MVNPRLVSFHRQYHAYSGGHQKVRDYLGHLLSDNHFCASLFLDNQSAIQPELFNSIPKLTYQTKYQPELADIVFLAGLDWRAYLPYFENEKPKVNLVQHVRHGDKNHPLFQFLKFKAIRICVSDAVKNAIEPHANGPCLTIKMGHDIPKFKTTKKYDLYILATKQVELGRRVESWAKKKKLRVLLHDSPQEKQQVHLSMAQSRVTLVLPNKTEGFYLPGIEAMALSDWVVLPDCIASREYALPHVNLSSCSHEMESCIEAVGNALNQLTRWNARFKGWQGKRLAAQYQLKAERSEFLQLMQSIEDYW